MRKKEKAIQKGLIQEIEIGVKSNNLYSLRDMHKEYLTKLHVPYVDSNDSAPNLEKLPVSYNKDEDKLSFYDPTTTNVIDITGINIVVRTDTVDTLDQIPTYNVLANNVLIVLDPIKGGQFQLYEGDDEPDDIMVITDSLLRKWKRITPDRKINVKWFGAEGASSDITNRLAIEAARDYIYSHRREVDTLYIPQATTGGGIYTFDDTLFFDETIKIVGDGVMFNPSTILRFPPNVRGIFFYEEQYDYFSELSNLYIQSTGGDPTDEEAHGIDVRCIVKMDNLYVTDFAGSGFNLEGCLSGSGSSNPQYGDVDYSMLTNCKATGNNHGFRIIGCDSNHIGFHNCWAQANRRWGFYDDSFLGCQFYGCQMAGNSNASIANANTTVTYLGNYYTATTLSDDGSNVDKNPVDFPAYWSPVVPQAADAWNDTTEYYSGGPFISLNPSGNSEWYSPYIEGDQPPPQMNSRSLLFGGVLGSGTPAGSISRSLGAFNLAGPTMVYGGNMAVGYLDPADMVYTFMVKSSDNGPIADFKSTAANAIMYVKSASTSSYLWSGVGGNLYFGTNDLQLVANAGELKDYTGNGVVNLGGAANRFKDVYAVTYNGSGTPLTFAGLPEHADNAAALLAGLTAGKIYRTGDLLKVVH